MGKLSALKEGLEKAVKHLDMSQAARMQRAAEQGFDAGKAWYRGSPVDEGSVLKKEMLGINTEAGSAKKGFFFASNPETASAPAYTTASDDLAIDYVNAKYGSMDNLVDRLSRFDKDKIRGRFEDFESLTGKMESSGWVPNEADQRLFDLLDDASHGDVEGMRGALAFLNGAPMLKLDGTEIKVSPQMKEAALSNFDELNSIYSADQDRRAVMAHLEEAGKFYDTYGENWQQGRLKDNEKAPNVGKFSLRMKNPYVYDMGGTHYREKSYSDILKEAAEKGHDSVIIKNTYDGGKEMTDIAVVFEPNQARSAFAAFDPAQKESSNLLASLTPGAIGTGLAALGLNPQETQAAINNYIQATQGSNPILENLNRNLQSVGMNERGVPVTGTMRQTPYPMLGKAADALRVVDTPIGPVFGGAADYLDKLAQGQNVTYGDRLGAALDLIP